MTASALIRAFPLALLGACCGPPVTIQFDATVDGDQLDRAGVEDAGVFADHRCVIACQLATNAMDVASCSLPVVSEDTGVNQPLSGRVTCTADYLQNCM